jgi:hypothetical protein
MSMRQLHELGDSWVWRLGAGSFAAADRLHLLEPVTLCCSILDPICALAVTTNSEIPSGERGRQSVA